MGSDRELAPRSGDAWQTKQANWELPNVTGWHQLLKLLYRDIHIAYHCLKRKSYFFIKNVDTISWELSKCCYCLFLWKTGCFLQDVFCCFSVFENLYQWRTTCCNTHCLQEVTGNSHICILPALNQWYNTVSTIFPVLVSVACKLNVLQ